MRRRAVLLLTLMTVALLVVASPAWATTFTVTFTGDQSDANLTDGICDANSARAGEQCTLRAAIEEANANTNAPTVVDVINFSIAGTGPHTIAPTSQLPVITEAVTIDGYSQGKSTTNTTSDDAKPNTLAVGNNAVLKVEVNGTNAGPAHGLVIQASDSTITGLVINRFVGNGVLISGSGATGNKVLGNFVGTNASGTEPLGNGGEGVEVFDASANTVGGAQAAARNVISGNTDDGVEFQGATLGNEILGNFIGTKANGIEALGNGNDGVHILGEGNTVGGTVSGTRNVISGNGGDGVDFQGVNTKDNRIEGNFIGTQASGTQDLGNGEDGVNIRDGAFDNTIGGTASGTGNRIAHNDQDGVSIASSTGNSVLSNSIFSNTGLGIDLGTSGVTNNDTDDPDTGANNLQNFPEVTTAKPTQKRVRGRIRRFTVIAGTLNSTPTTTFTIQLFRNLSGEDEGRILLTQFPSVTTDADGNASFSIRVRRSRAPVGSAITATATNNPTGDTSEFSAAKTVG